MSAHCVIRHLAVLAPSTSTYLATNRTARMCAPSANGHLNGMITCEFYTCIPFWQTADANFLSPFGNIEPTTVFSSSVEPIVIVTSALNKQEHSNHIFVILNS